MFMRAKMQIIAGAGAIGLIVLAARDVIPTASRSSPTCKPTLLAELPLQIHTFDVSLPVTVNGQEAQFGLDTGTSDSYVLEPSVGMFRLPAAPAPDNWVVNSLGENSNQTAFVSIAHLRFAGRDYWRRVMPVTTIASAPGGTQIEAGTIGADLLKDLDVDLDIPHARIAFFSAPTACVDHRPPWVAASARVEITPLGSGSPTIPVAYDGVVLPTLFATYWERTLVMDFPLGTAGHPSLISEKPPLAPLATIKTIAIGAATDGPFTVRLWRKPPAVSYATHPEASNVSTLGFDVIRRHRFWLSLASKQLFIALPN
jgi:hypothetical protein